MDKIVCDCGETMRIIGGKDSTVKTAWCQKCGTEKVYFVVKVD